MNYKEDDVDLFGFKICDFFNSTKVIDLEKSRFSQSKVSIELKKSKYLSAYFFLIAFATWWLIRDAISANPPRFVIFIAKTFSVLCALGGLIHAFSKIQYRLSKRGNFEIILSLFGVIHSVRIPLLKISTFTCENVVEIHSDINDQSVKQFFRSYSLILKGGRSILLFKTAYAGPQFPDATQPFIIERMIEIFHEAGIQFVSI